MVRDLLVAVLLVSCGSGRSAQSDVRSDSVAAPDTTEAVDTVVTSGTDASPTSGGPSQLMALSECMTSHGIEMSAPARAYPPEVADEAWSACRDTHLAALRESIAQFNQVNAALPAEAEPLAFADCMATYGWVTTLSPQPPMEDVADYTTANAACKLPVEGESREASYCRFLNAIYDRGIHDRSVSITGTPYGGGDEARLEAAVALYDEALRIAPDEMVDDLQTLRDSFQDGTPIPDEVWERMIDYNLSVCGVWVYLGSLD